MPDTTFAGATPAAPTRPGRNWTVLRRLIAAWFRDRGQFARPVIARTCPMCGHHGMFVSVGRPARWDVRCPNCGGRERHRLTHLWATAGGSDTFAGKRILHFAPEKAVRRQMRGNPLYETADLHQRGTTHKVDITRVDLPDARYDVVIAHHVLEHIDDDRAAIAELFRLLKPGGTAVLSVPINPTRHATYENPAIATPELRVLHFGGDDHKRYYGLDFADRLADAGFAVETFRMPPEDEVRYGLLRDEWIYIATKPDARPPR
ncbi:MAG TPA: methyltransferase domain-containing protein [Candidatus Sulfotelmatobacter sp.]|nr:methyltransferase domain-containing protein [Candidatus Sulfotelmatobacter sp.]